MVSTIRDILVQTEAKFGAEDAIRYKVGKGTVASKTYTDLKNDSECFSNVLCKLEERGSHIAITGATSYMWLTAYMGTVNSGSVAVPASPEIPPNPSA